MKKKKYIGTEKMFSITGREHSTEKTVPPSDDQTYCHMWKENPAIIKHKGSGKQTLAELREESEKENRTIT